MVRLLGKAEQKIKDAAERLEKTSTAEHAPALEPAFPYLAGRIKSGTVTVADIDSFLNSSPQVQPDLREYLLYKKGYLLFQQGKQEEGLRNYDSALSTKETPSTWALKGTALLQMERIEEAIQAFQKAYKLRDEFGPQKREYLKDLFAAWGTTIFFLGLDAVLEQDARELGRWVNEFLDIQEKSRNEGIEGTEVKVVTGEDGESIPQQLRNAVEEWELAVRLLSIKDPFEGLRALSKEISKHWPEGVSAVDAVREQRDREWNT